MHCCGSRVILTVGLVLAAAASQAQVQINYTLTRCGNPSLNLFTTRTPSADTIAPVMDKHALLIDRPDFDSLLTVAAHMRPATPKGYFAPPVFGSIAYLDSLTLMPVERDPEFADAFTWVDNAQWHDNLMRRARQQYMVAYPNLITRNVRTLPVPPKNFHAFVDPVTTMIVLEPDEMKPSDNPDRLPVDIAPKHWIKSFAASLQFSQAYISPNWYQGGNSNLNMIAQLVYDVKLNQKLHPNLMFEANVQYKLGMNSAPDDTVRSYNISEDLFQATAKVGVKAFKRWYYSSNVMFKTQLFNSYPSNGRA